ncbi:MAG TPA: SDR family NAD(P)-dependent oxidoreductase [Polyangiaceae bacterium]|nr:SDR family NAD(P)-dependent oxidoreductase [Polyangiaceae bacterium]
MSRAAYAGKLVVITGAASGIGEATALAFAEQGAALELADIDSTGLPRVAAEAMRRGALRADTTVLDVSDPVAVLAFAWVVHGRGSAVDVLVNNAGVCLVGGFLDTRVEDWAWMLGVNLWGLIHVTRAFAPRMLERGSGQIMNVASASAFYNPVLLGAYGATKYAVFGLSEALRQEYAPRGVGVSVVCPGVVKTPLIDHLRLRGRYTEEPQRRELRRVVSEGGLGPEVVAHAIVRAARGRKAVVPVGLQAWGLYLLKRLTPALLPSLFRRFATTPASNAASTAPPPRSR